MKYYSYVEYTEDDGILVVTKSEKEIADEYYSYWYERMYKKFGKEHVDATYTKQDCIDDWVVTHWAWVSSTPGVAWEN